MTKSAMAVPGELEGAVRDIKKAEKVCGAAERVSEVADREERTKKVKDCLRPVTISLPCPAVHL